MKPGMDMPDLLTELQRREKTKRDFIAPSYKLSVEPTRLVDTNGDTNSRFSMRIPLGGSEESFPILPHAHRQIAERIKIPFDYYERCMAEENPPGLLSNQVNYWMQRSGENRLARTLDGSLRAFISDRYRPLDNWDLFRAVAPELKQAVGVRIVSANITPTQFYVKAFTARVTGEVRVGQVVEAGVYISNSEVGDGALSVEPAVLVLACLNGMTIKRAGMRKHHLGRRKEEGELERFFSEETRNKDDEALWGKVRDLTRAALTQASFDSILGMMRESADRPIPKERKADQVVEVINRRFSTTSDEAEQIMRLLYESGDLTQWGLSQAVTLHAQSAPDYDRASTLEKIGGDIVELAPKDWEAAFSKVA